MPYLRITCPRLDPDRYRDIAEDVTGAVVELFTPPRGPSGTDIRERTTVHFTSYEDDELFVGGRAVINSRPDVTVELSDWPCRCADNAGSQLGSPRCWSASSRPSPAR
jgi:phenylpyruvate tautomerase PptA (4-oxalocrotonate tautomerase family)